MSSNTSGTLNRKWSLKGWTDDIFPSQQPSESPFHVLKFLNIQLHFTVGALTIAGQILVQKWVNSRLANLDNGLAAKGSVWQLANLKHLESMWGPRTTQITNPTECVGRKWGENGGDVSPCAFSLTSIFLPYHSPDFVVFSNSFVLMHAINTQVLRTSGLIGKKMSTVVFSVWIFFFLVDSIFVLCVSTENVFDLLFEKGWQFNRR